MSRTWYIDAFGHPLADVRAKLIDEGWFGRKTTDPVQSKDWGWIRGEPASTDHPSHAPRQADDLGWSRDEQPKPEHSPHIDRDEDRGIDR